MYSASRMTTSTRATVSPTTAADVAAFFPKGISWRIRALTVRVDDTIIGIGGLAYLPDPDATVAAFIECSEDDARKYPVTLMKAAKMTLAMAREHGIRRMVALGDTARDAAPRFLERLGFRQAGTINGKKIYLKDGRA